MGLGCRARRRGRRKPPHTSYGLHVLGWQVRGWSESDPRRFAREPARLAVRVHVSRSAAQKPQRHSSPRTHNSWTCTRQPTATERAGARAALRIRRAAPYRCCRRLQGRSGERRRPLNDRRGDAVQGAAVARDKLSSAFLCTVTARQSRQRAQRVTRAEQPRACAHCGRAVVAANRMAAAAARSQREQIEMGIRHSLGALPRS